ncbi:MAG: PA2778 family cysteine peptidase [Pseudomonadota bacterium]
MKLIRIIAVLSFIILLLPGCTAIFIANHVVPKKPEIKPGDVVIDVPFIKQDKFYCGPASLTMVADYYGRDLTLKQVEQLMYLPVVNGSLQTELQATARSMKFAAFPMNLNRETLSAEIDQERPIIVLQNLSLEVYPVWHYSVVVGRSPNIDHLLLHSGQHQYYRIPWHTFENTWKRSKQWALVLLPPGELPESISEPQALQAALDLETTGNYRSAQLTYKAITKRWPNSFKAYVGLANTHMQLKEPLAASNSYQKALKLNKQSTKTLNNFAYSAYQLGCEITAIAAAKCAYKMSGSNQKILTTLNELKAKSKTPRNHNYCPRILCNSQSLAANSLNSRI